MIVTLAKLDIGYAELQKNMFVVANKVSFTATSTTAVTMTILKI